jgi:hypothetical protein
MARTVAEIEAEIAKLQAEFDAVQAAARASGDINSPLLNTREQLRAQIAQLRRELRTAVAQENGTQPQPPATASQTAQDDGPDGPTKPAAQQVEASGKIVTPPATTSPTNAEKTATTDAGGGDTGTDGRTRTLTETQATGPTTPGPIAEPPPAVTANSPAGAAGEQARIAADSPTLATAPGAGAANDDAAKNSAESAQVDVNATNTTTVYVKPRTNTLDKFFSYTYSISVYMLTVKQYQSMMYSKNKKIDGYYLLFQSGGAANNVGGVRNLDGFAPSNTQYGAFGEEPTASPPPADGGRNPFFPLDYYIDSVTLDTSPLGRATGASHMTASLKFTVQETMGITLIDNLNQAARNISAVDEGTGQPNYTNTDYLMIIRFYGYDQNGKQVEIRGGVNNTLIEKYIPFKVNAINWSVGSKLISYDWDCTPQGQQIGGFTARGAVPYDVQLVDSTVEGLLAGSLTFAGGATQAANPGASTTSGAGAGRGSSNDPRRTDAASTQAPQKAIAAPTSKTTITKGLMDAMNKFQDDLVSQGIYKIPDRYSIEFIGTDKTSRADIADAKLQLPATKVDKAKTAGGKTATQDTSSLKPETNAVDMISRSFSITAGQMLTQAIELVIRNSNYITDQAIVVLQPDGTYLPNPQAKDEVSWFTIMMSATERPGGIDTQRNDYAYDIRYTVAPYIVKNVASQYFPVSTFSGIHKSYPYWFTGQNTAVLEYQEQLNALYSLTVSGDNPKYSALAEERKNFSSSMRDIVKYNYAPRSTESSSGADGKSNEIGANLTEDLMSPGDLANCKIKIIGDPDWIQQGSLFQPVTPGSYNVEATTGWNEDGSIGFDCGDVLFEIVWQRPEDYDLATGLADPYAVTQKKYGNREPIQSRVYVCTKVISEFRQGRFEQTVEGTLYRYPKPDGTNAIAPVQDNKASERGQASTAGASGTPDESSAETARLKAQSKRLKSAAETPKPTSTTGTTPTSSTAQGVQQLLNPPTTLADPTLTQLQSSPVYNAARRSGQTPQASLDAARQAFAATAGGSPVTSNGQAVSTSQVGGPPKLGGGGAGLSADQARQAQNIPQNPTNSTNPTQQTMAKTT